jgi:hypothetical protein
MVSLLPYMGKETEDIYITVVMDTLDHAVDRYVCTTSSNTGTKERDKHQLIEI